MGRILVGMSELWETCGVSMPFTWKKDCFCVLPASVMLKLVRITPNGKQYQATCLSKVKDFTADSTPQARLVAEQWLLEILQDVSLDLFSRLDPLDSSNGK